MAIDFLVGDEWLGLGLAEVGDLGALLSRVERGWGKRV